MAQGSDEPSIRGICHAVIGHHWGQPEIERKSIGGRHEALGFWKESREMKRSSGFFVFALCLVLAAGSAWLSAEKQEDQKAKKEKKRETYTAVAIGTGGGLGGKTMNLTFYIEEYTTDDQVREYLGILKEKGNDGLRKVLEKVEVGRVAPAATTGTDLAIARKLTGADGQQIIRVVSARPVSFLELYRSGRSTDYPFTIIELQLKSDGTGVGAVIGAAQLDFDDKGVLQIESYGNQYVKLSNVKIWD
jgi:hypothetical protein